MVSYTEPSRNYLEKVRQSQKHLAEIPSSSDTSDIAITLTS